MKIAILIYPDLTLLDLVGFTDAVHRLRTMNFVPSLRVQYVAFGKPVADNYGFPIPVDVIKPDLSHYDMVFIPGGFGSRLMLQHVPFVHWLETAKEVTHKVSVCTGSLLLGAAGFLESRKATTHFEAFDQLHRYTREVIKADLVDDQHIVTGGAVAYSIVVGLHVCRKLAGKEAAEQIAIRMGADGLYERSNVQIY